MNLLENKYDKYSSTGNDGIIEKIFDILKQGGAGYPKNQLDIDYSSGGD